MNGNTKNTYTVLFCGFGASPTVFCGESCSFPESWGGLRCDLQWSVEFCGGLRFSCIPMNTLSSPIRFYHFLSPAVLTSLILLYPCLPWF